MSILIDSDAGRLPGPEDRPLFNSIMEAIEMMKDHIVSQPQIISKFARDV
jgi:hypothetical protein